MKHLICFFDSSLELVSKELASHPQMVKDVRRKGKKPFEMILERSRHHKAMPSLKNSLKRGRPDILHTCLKIVSDSPIYKQGLVDLVVHTVDSKWIVFKDRIRFPVSYDNFKGLMEKLLLEGRIIEPGGRMLMKVASREDACKILNSFPRKILLTRVGRIVELGEYVKNVSTQGKPACFFIGAYARGRPSEEIWRMADEKISIYKDVLTAWTVTAWLTYEVFRSHSPSI